MRRDFVTFRKTLRMTPMDAIKLDGEEAGHWGVVYSYGSVLAVFDNEQDAQNEAACFGGAAVQIALSVWTALCAAHVTAPS